MEQREVQVISRKERGFAWVAAIFVSLCCLYTCLVLVESTGSFKELFKGLGVELPLATRFLISTYIWLYPLLFIAAAVLVITKEFMLRDLRLRITTTGIVFLAAISSVGLVQYVMNLPLLDLVQKLSQIK